MPFAGMNLCCPNHPDVSLLRDQRMFQFVGIGRPPEDRRAFDATVVVYSCPTCGYVEMYRPEQL